jgi:glutamate/aspartate transport system substrate-binding protein
MRLSKLAAIIIALALFFKLSQAQALSPTLKKIKDNKEIILGVQDTSIPFSYIDDQQNYQGYSIDLCLKATEEIKKNLGLNSLKIKMISVNSATRIPLIANGAVSMVCGSATNNMDRQKAVAFAPTMYVAATRLLAKKSSHINSLDDMKNKTLIAISGTSNIKLVTMLNDQRKLGMNIIIAKDFADGFLMLETGRGVAYTTDDVLLASLAASSKSPNDYAFVKEALSVEPYGIMLNRDDLEFKNMVDKALSNLYKSPEINQIYAKWFLSPIPPKNINLNMPMSDELKMVLAKPTDSGKAEDYIVLNNKK